MKKLSILATAFVVLLSVQSVTFACECKNKSGDYQKHVKHMTKNLNLTEEQSQKVEALLKAQGDVMKKNREEFQEKMKSVLTEEQFKKFQEKSKKRFEK